MNHHHSGFHFDRCPKVVIFLFQTMMIISCSPGKKAEPVDLSFSVTRVFPHDTAAFTQGLVIDQGKLFESTGREGHSWIAEVDIASGRQDKKIGLEKKYFGEGITILGNKLYQLTWQNKTGFVYDLRTFSRVRDFHYEHEGWGITHDGTHLIVSDGTDKLHFMDTLTMKEVKVISVRDDFGPVQSLNELEFIDGAVFANQWQTNYIWRIDPSSGQVTGRMDLSVMAEKTRMVNPGADVLNGIAFEKKSGLMLVTGKLWPYLYAVKLKPDAARQ